MRSGCFRREAQDTPAVTSTCENAEGRRRSRTIITSLRRFGSSPPMISHPIAATPVAVCAPGHLNEGADSSVRSAVPLDSRLPCGFRHPTRGGHPENAIAEAKCGDEAGAATARQHHEEFDPLLPTDRRAFQGGPQEPVSARRKGAGRERPMFPAIPRTG